MGCVGGRGEADLNQLLHRFHSSGDAAAMEEFLQRTRPRLLATAQRIGNPQEAEDCVQAAYHSLLRRGGAPTEAPQAWLSVAVVRIAYRRKALSKREARLAEKLAVDRDRSDPGRAAERKETARLLRSEVARLPAKYRDVVVLHYLEGLSVGESARLLDVPPPTVQTRLRRARRLLEGRCCSSRGCSRTRPGPRWPAPLR
ncbi:MAG: RNA polymerase sigma factor [Planctomycetota bacterium]|jgi:RNA polymerase sigma-70 factor (ECF subfamily)